MRNHGGDIRLRASIGFSDSLTFIEVLLAVFCNWTAVGPKLSGVWLILVFGTGSFVAVPRVSLVLGPWLVVLDMLYLFDYY